MYLMGEGSTGSHGWEEWCKASSDFWCSRKDENEDLLFCQERARALGAFSTQFRWFSPKLADSTPDTNNPLWILMHRNGVFIVGLHFNHPGVEAAVAFNNSNSELTNGGYFGANRGYRVTSTSEEEAAAIGRSQPGELIKVEIAQSLQDNVGTGKRKRGAKAVHPGMLLCNLNIPGKENGAVSQLFPIRCPIHGVLIDFNDRIQKVFHTLTKKPISLREAVGMLCIAVIQGVSPKQQAKRRLLRDFKRLQSVPSAGVSATPIENNILKWHALILGPPGTVWEGGVFRLSMDFSEDYPNKPPAIKFLTRVFHPNVYLDGSLCLDILQSQWSPVYDILGILISIRSLLCDPNPNSPANNEAAQLYSKDRREYNRKIIQCVKDSWDQAPVTGPTETPAEGLATSSGNSASEAEQPEAGRFETEATDRLPLNGTIAP